MDVVQWRSNSSGGTGYIRVRGWHQDHAPSAVLCAGEGEGSQIPGAKCSTCLFGRRQFRLEQRLRPLHGTRRAMTPHPVQPPPTPAARRCKSCARGCTACPSPHPDDLDPDMERKMDTSTMNTARGLLGKTDSAALVKAVCRTILDFQTVGEHRPDAYHFPPPDPVARLAELYFTRAHIYLPVLHRQTFDRSVEAGMHHWADGFALVCTIGSRWSHDPRVFRPPEKASRIECGWEW
ncbi:hypothetical protein C8R44DRAFT_989782 [Mycena epipterygia]|nr:hypothetical protein C8R44DRAFT_989782 [Mycena epipterygia]